MADPAHIATLKCGLNRWNEWRARNPATIPDLEAADLQRLDLSGFDLTKACLRKTDLRGVQFGQANLADADLRESALLDADLRGAGGVYSSQFSGADLSGAKLPELLEGRFNHLEPIKAITENAQKLFIGTLAACLYSWLTIATTTDGNLVTNQASSPLPIIQTVIPIVGFYAVAPLLLIGIYLYFHLYVQKLCDELGSLPAIFPDGMPLQSKADPWLLSDLVRSHVSMLKADRPFLSYLQGWISILLAWWVVPITLICFWVRYLPRHDNVLTAFHCVLTAISIVAAIFLYRLASSTLSGTHRKPFLWSTVLKEPASLQPIFVVIVVSITFALISVGAIDGVRSGVPGRDWWPSANGPPRWVPAVMEKLGYSPFADLRGANLSLKPATWIGKSDTELNVIKGPQLSGVDLRYADMRGVFLVGALLTLIRK